MTELKLYRVSATLPTSYDDLKDAVVWAPGPQEAVDAVAAWYDNYFKAPNDGLGRGDWAGPYAATEVVPESGRVVLTHVVYG